MRRSYGLNSVLRRKELRTAYVNTLCARTPYWLLINRTLYWFGHHVRVNRSLCKVVPHRRESVYLCSLCSGIKTSISLLGNIRVVGCQT